MTTTRTDYRTSWALAALLNITKRPRGIRFQPCDHCGSPYNMSYRLVNMPQAADVEECMVYCPVCTRITKSTRPR